MAAKNKVWNIDVEGIPYKIEFEKNKVIINNGTPLKLKQLKKLSGSTVETNYELPIENGDVVLHIRTSELILSYRNRDCETGEEYVPMTIPGWAWVFVVLHALNFSLLLGGAVGDHSGGDHTDVEAHKGNDVGHGDERGDQKGIGDSKQKQRNIDHHRNDQRVDQLALDETTEGTVSDGADSRDALVYQIAEECSTKLHHLRIALFLGCQQING